MNVSAVVFAVVACGLAWLVTIPLWSGGGLDSPSLGALSQAMMWAPTVATLVVLVGFRPVAPGRRLVFLGIRPIRPLRRLACFSLLGLGLTSAVILLSLALAAAFGWVQLDLAQLSGFRTVIEQESPENGAVSASTAWSVVLVQLAVAPVAAVTVNALFAFGEELGWRGFLLPVLLPLGPWPAILITGGVWGLWHTPLVLMGFNFDRPDWSGVALMVLGCVAWGILLGWLRLRAESLWPAVFAHAMLNAVGPAIGWFYSANSTFDLALAGPLGVAGWISCAIVMLAIARVTPFKRGPEPPRRVLALPSSLR